MEWMLLPLKRYADFSGRSRRKEYWMFFLFNLGVALVLNIVLGGAILSGDEGGAAMGGAGVIVILLYVLLTFIPGLAVTVRRFHDQDKSGWMVLLALVPLVGSVILIVFMCLEGTRGANRFGPDPKADDAMQALA